MFPYSDTPDTTRQFLHQVLEEIFVYLKSSNNREEKVLEFKQPRDLKENEELKISLASEKSSSLEQILSDIKNTLRFCVKTGKFNFEYSYAAYGMRQIMTITQILAKPQIVAKKSGQIPNNGQISNSGKRSDKGDIPNSG